MPPLAASRAFFRSVVVSIHFFDALLGNCTASIAKSPCRSACLIKISALQVPRLLKLVSPSVVVGAFSATSNIYDPGVWRDAVRWKIGNHAGRSYM